METIQEAQVHYITTRQGGLKKVLPKHINVKHLGFEADHLTFDQHHKLSNLLPNINLVGTTDIISNHRIIKTKEEIQYIKQAQHITDETFAQVIQLIKPGITELQIQQKLLTIMADLGSQEPAFTPVVAFGPNAATLHAMATTKPLKKQESILLDFGASINSYKSDMTRMVHMGNASTEFNNHYQFVLQALLSATAHIEPNINASQIHQVIVEHYGSDIEYMPHTTGHGIGIQAHEAPHLYTAQEQPLKPGTVITIEPGIYFPNKYGIRIEDMGYLDETKFQVLTDSPHELIQL